MVSISVHPLTSIKEKTVGLLGTKKAYPVLLRTRFGIHTFGMKYPIDVVVLDKDNTIKKLEANLKPNRLFFWNPLFEKVVELPHDMTRELGLRVGMHISLRSF